jgi:hypothetical protein
MKYSGQHAPADSGKTQDSRFDRPHQIVPAPRLAKAVKDTIGQRPLTANIDRRTNGGVFQTWRRPN